MVTPPRAADGPLTSDDIEALGNQLFDGPGEPFLLIAVSGGADSVALMHVMAELVRKRGKGQILVATVDHGLRAGSADDARFVIEESTRLGLQSEVLRWEGEKPATGIQASARGARYRLLAGLYHRQRWPHAKWLVTAHTLDDQAETFMMRLARGSGVDGLSAMSPVVRFTVASENFAPPPGIERTNAAMGVVRPFLHIPKARLIATLQERQLPWREDPSNENVDFERVRVRRALAALEELGVTSAAIALSAKRLGVVSESLNSEAVRALAVAGLVMISPYGYAELSRDIWTGPQRRLSEAVALRVLGFAVRIVGAHEKQLSLQALESAADQVAWACRQSDAPFAMTLGRTRISLHKSTVLIIREVGRDAPAPVAFAPGQEVLWDNRFRVSLGQNAVPSLILRCLGPNGRTILKSRNQWHSAVPTGALLALPAFWSGDSLAGLPDFSPGTVAFGAPVGRATFEVDASRHIRPD